MKPQSHPIEQSGQMVSTASETVMPVMHDHAVTLHSALAFHQNGALDEAEALYQAILLQNPEHFDALQLLATIAAQRNESEKAVALFDQALNINPDHSGSLNNRGNALRSLQRYEDALRSFERAVAVKPDYADAYINRGNVLMELLRCEDALESFEKAIALKPDYAPAYFNRGNAVMAMHRYEDALASYEKAIALNPCFADAYYNKGLALQKLMRYDDALERYKQAIALKPDYTEAFLHQGNVFMALQRYENALLSYEHVIALNPDDVEAYTNRGYALQELKRYGDALLSYDRVLALKCDDADAYNNRGNAFMALKRYEDALGSYNHVLALKPDYDFLSGLCLYTRMKICEWNAFDDQVDQLEKKIERHEKATLPFPFLAIKDSLSLQQDAARIFAGEKFPVTHLLSPIPKRSRRDTIRIGYFSADFCNHPVSFLTAELFEMHDRGRFELYAFSCGSDTGDGMRRRLEVAFEHFHDVRNHSDKDIALLARSLEIDIAIDLGGFTMGSRTGIFALRAAPVQVSYIGYLGTMGAGYIDYLIADEVLIPEGSRKHYTEKIAYLSSYQVNDTKRRIADRVFTRAECGLPESGFVFCCFNNNYKITPATFDGWMRILGQVEGSVLFLYTDNEAAASNLKKEAESRGVKRDRLIFGKRLPLAEHLARYRVADLFLDTLPYNAGTTASDALWAGLPVLTLRGESFASRMAASLLTAIGLPELITTTQEEYEARAIELALDPEKMRATREKLARNRLTTRLFDTRLFTRNIEAAYLAMYERYQEGLPPDHLVVSLSPLSSMERSVARPSHAAGRSTNEESVKLQRALTLHQEGRLDEAEALYREILSSSPEHFDALQLSATIAAQRHDSEQALVLFDQAISINPGHPGSRNNRGNALRALQRYEEALDSYEKALQLKPDYVDAYTNRGSVLLELKRYEEALASYERAIAIKPDHTEFYSDLAVVLLALKRYEEALATYERVLELRRDDPVVYNNRGNVLLELKRYEEALGSYEKAIALNPDYAEAYSNLGVTRKVLKRDEEALGSYEKAIALKPDFADAYYNRAVLFYDLDRYEEALASYDRAIVLKPDFVEVFSNRGNALLKLKRYEEALGSYEKAIALKPDFADAFFNQGNALLELKRYEDALWSYEKTLACKPDYDFLSGFCLYTRMKICDWSAFEDQVHQLEKKIECHEKVVTPFPLLAIKDDLFLQHDVVRIFAKEKFPANQTLSPIPKRSRRDTIRIGYYSADFCNHPVSFLTAELFEMHDRGRFELYAFSCGSDTGDEMRRRLEVAFDRFLDVRNHSDKDIALMSRDLEIDIAVDLGGFTMGSRTGIFALRAAPVQVSYIGYLGTMGAGYIDYLIADEVLIPEGSRKHYTEKIAYLSSYQVNDTKRRIADRVFTRAECGLPESGFVFCCFNNNYKITPATFDGWMRILGQVPGSVLWLFEENAKAAENLRREAASRGVDAGRLIFGKRLPVAEYLARYRVADLFLDTLPYNAGTTASDALWAGLPVLTLRGESFASRMAASLLTAIGLPELITSGQEEYESLAIELALDPEMMRATREKLARNRLTTRLFDTGRFTRNIEAAYLAMYERYQEGLPPDHLVVSLSPLSTVERSVARPSHAAGRSTKEESVKLQRALKLHQEGRLDEAEALYREILSFSPEHFDALQLSATIAAQRHDSENALVLFDQALAIKPDHARSLNNRGIALQELKRYEEALASYERAIAVKPDFIEPYSNRGNTLQELKRYEEALACYDSAIALKPDYAEPYYNQGNALLELKRDEDAVRSYEKALALKPDYDFLSGLCLHIRMKICDWLAFDDQAHQLEKKIECHEKASPPFAVLSITESLSLQQEAARVYAQEKFPADQTLSSIAKRPRRDTIRIGYYSADFCNHPVSILTAELFEMHDRARFELYAFSCGTNTGDEMRRRLEVAFDRFLDVRNHSDKDIVLMSRDLEIDIAVDLGGFTMGSRTGIFALRAAPVQVSYIGYLGTMGAGYIDYLIADEVLIPEGSRKHYTEKIAYLSSYQVNDTKRRIADRVFTRAECGLPESGFVFCCFNNNYKITPATFDGWMRILGQVPGSVLFLYTDNEAAASNLKKEAESRGVKRDRLIFGKRLPLAEHLARYRVADLFLDTNPYNAGTTASDALWAGLPVLTLRGESFASRMAASLLTAIGLPELITSGQEEYEALAVELALDPEKMRATREKLARNRLTTRLFDTRLFTRNIEAAYLAMYERYQEGLPPDHLVVSLSPLSSMERRVALPSQMEGLSTNEESVKLQRALKLHQEGRLDEAEAICQEILSSIPEHFDALQLSATIAAQRHDSEKALALFDQALAIKPDHARSLNNRGIALQELKRYEEALASYERLLAVKPDYAMAYSNRGNTLQGLRRYEEAVSSYDQAIALRSDNANAYSNRGVAMMKLKRYADALESHDKAIALRPDYAEACSNRGNTLQELKRYEEALMSYKQAIALKSDYAEFYSNYGNVLEELKRYEEALLNYEQAIALKPDFSDAYSNLGNTLQVLMRYRDALASYDKAIGLNPDCIEAYCGQGNALLELMRYEEALVSYERALALKPEYDFLPGLCLYTRMKICAWSAFDDQVHQLEKKIERHEKASPPLVFLSITESLSLQQEAARVYAQEIFPPNQTLSPIPKRSRRDTIRIGYFSADFCHHPVSFLTAELFETHHKDRFELYAFSFGQDTGDEMRRRLEVAFDRFLDVRNYSDKDIALLSRTLEIDIAIDLGGFTMGSRTGIFALRAAPVQVSYIGYLGTMGAGYIDYLLADDVLIPEGSRKHYTEKIAYLSSYQVNDTKRRIADRVFTRAECGLPESGFVFCCFNNTYKITPATFDGWMRILGQVPGSVLWLYEENAKAAENLRREAASRGVDAGRLIFGKRLPVAEYLARYRVADLFLDTLPYNAGTTASDALWAGLPVLTLRGESFASRMAASLLTAIGLPELITSGQEEYESLAIELALDPEMMRVTREKLARNRLTTRLFDTGRFTRNIEAAFEAMYERYQEGLPPDHLVVVSLSPAQGEI
ncbi:O-linked N-acetylglucosamine transferase family protein [Chlorobium phaeobacteroides]|uniref:protein O-GlcNAc transferase n=1 Tax=Chlorobium phaeobacteroides (strain DSM 266 / SMG 266 / 2430) TaxID=290317 RepID=A1BHI0_CHLPD|nr:tetratricopeptide repeat protein [Chlorobium phaeobacteroides]ABL65857.1 TPR repeat-containing protein [Chlorobium phaeobacteroides DSM 266]